MNSIEAEISQLSALEVCSIIEACSKGLVTELKFRGLELKRERREDPISHVPYPVAEITESQHKQLTKASLEAEEMDMREQQLRELAITDPLAFEKMLAEGELEGNHDAESDDSDLFTD